MRGPLASAALLLLLVAAIAGGCSLLHDDYPDRSCEGNSDCFRAQGEYCERDAGVCLQGPDAAPEAAAREDQPAADSAGDQPPAAAPPREELEP